MEFIYFIGVDVSKNELDLAVYKGKDFLFHQEIDNNKDAINGFVKELKKQKDFVLASAVFCMEHTGIYNNPLIMYLHKKKGNIWLEAASHIKSSLGNIRGKNDKVDSIRIGKFAVKNRDDVKLWTPKRDVINRLSDLTTLRQRLINAKKMLQTPLKEQDGFVKRSTANQFKKICQRSLNSLEADLAKVEKAINELINEDESLAPLFQIVTSVQGIGKVTAVNMIITTNEFKDINDPRKFACYSGVAPFSKESGIFKGKAKVSHMANKKMKTLLHMAALVAIVYNPELKKYYDRKVEEGKNKMSVINAVRNKLIHRVFACVRENKMYENNYSHMLV
jgi:transposase